MIFNNKLIKHIYKHTPGIALTETKVSAKCCNLFEKDGEKREGGKVITATAFDDRMVFFRDLTKESISHSYQNNTQVICERI